jgi:rare lipoprotein A
MARNVEIILLTFSLIIMTTSCIPDPKYRSEARADSSQPPAAEAPAISASNSNVMSGIASFTADETHGRKTANGEMYDMRQLVAAHRTLPFNTIVEVKNLKNSKTVQVRINDRGPYVDGRIIDLSFEAAKAIDLVESGSGMVELRVLKLGK